MADKSYAKELVRARTGRDPDDLLRELYLDRRHSQLEIAKAMGISRSTVSDWIRDLGISRDDRPAVAL